jgi:hypothetical protein
MPATGKSWEQFALRLEGASTVVQARDLAFDAPPPSQPAERQFHSNLLHFHFNLKPPRRSMSFRPIFGFWIASLEARN